MVPLGAAPVQAGQVEQVEDLRPAVAEAMREGRHHAAAELAAQWERAIVRIQGPQCAAMGAVLEVQAHAAGAAVRAVQRWLDCCEHRLAWAPPHDPAVQLAARNSLACWNRLDDDEPPLADLGQRLAEALRTCGHPTAADAVEARMADLAGPAYQPPTMWIG